MHVSNIPEVERSAEPTYAWEEGRSNCRVASPSVRASPPRGCGRQWASLWPITRDHTSSSGSCSP